MKLLILSDIHANWPALEAVLNAEFDFDMAVFCGDVVDYGPHPLKCLHWVAENATYKVRGNHDHALAFLVDCHCMGSFREYSIATRNSHRTLVQGSDLLTLRRWPTIERFEWQGRRFHMSHATPLGDMYRYVPMSQWGELVAGIEADFVLLGHTHVQGMRTFGELTIVSPGSVGLARDGAGEACYAVYDGDTLALRRTSYDFDRTVFDLRRAPLPSHVIEGLRTILRPMDNAQLLEGALISDRAGGAQPLD